MIENLQCILFVTHRCVMISFALPSVPDDRSFRRSFTPARSPTGRSFVLFVHCLRGKYIRHARYPRRSSVRLLPTEGLSSFVPAVRYRRRTYVRTYVSTDGRTDGRAGTHATKQRKSNDPKRNLVQSLHRIRARVRRSIKKINLCLPSNRSIRTAW